jgi:hypothetical protein
MKVESSNLILHICKSYKIKFKSKVSPKNCKIIEEFFNTIGRLHALSILNMVGLLTKPAPTFQTFTI